MPPLFAFIFVFFGVSLITLAGINEKAAQQLEVKLEQHKNLINETEKKQRQILSNLFVINQRIKKISKEKSNLENERQLLEVSILDLKEQIEDLQLNLQGTGRELISHIRLLQQAKGFGWLNLLSGSEGPAEADLNLYIFTRMTNQEKRKIQQYFAQKVQFQKSQAKLQHRLERLDKVTKDLAVREKDFLSEQTFRQTTLNEIKSKKLRILEKLKNLRDTQLAQKLEDTGLLDSLTQASFLEGKGNLDGPIKGLLKQRFGIVQTPRANYYKNHKGIFIQAKAPQQIQAVFDGKVAFVGEMGGFGSTLIVDHGDHYYTVYSTLSEIDVHEGQFVNKHDRLAKTGASKFYSEPGVYFEVRHFSEPQDPMEWIKKGSL